MQGRLSPLPSGRAQRFPLATWRDEFASAAALGFDAVEWLVTADSIAENPWMTRAGISEIRDVMASTGVLVPSICADCFIHDSLLDLDEAGRERWLRDLAVIIGHASRIGASTVVLPMLEHSALRDDEHARALVAALHAALEIAQQHGVVIALETDWPGAAIAPVIHATTHAALGVCYDVGNAVAAGHDPADDVRALEGLLRTVHVKDRVRGGGSVPIGVGAVDFSEFLTALDSISYGGPLILETPVADDAIESATSNLQRIREFMRLPAGSTR